VAVVTRSYWVAVWSARLALVMVSGGFCLVFLVARTESTIYLDMLGVYWLVTLAVMNVARFAAASIGVPVGRRFRFSGADERTRRMKWDFFCYDVLGLRAHADTDQVGIQHVLLCRTSECWLFSLYLEPGGISSDELAGTAPDAPAEVAQQDLLRHLRDTWQFTGRLAWEQTKPDWWAAEPADEPASDRELGQAPT
jgi:hypothetical protein